VVNLQVAVVVVLELLAQQVQVAVVVQQQVDQTIVTQHLLQQIQVQVLVQLEQVAHQIQLVKAEAVSVSSVTQEHKLEAVDLL
jgi:hypothetical protein